MKNSGRYLLIVAVLVVVLAAGACAASQPSTPAPAPTAATESQTSVPTEVATPASVSQQPTAAPSSAEVVTLRVADSIPATHVLSKTGVGTFIRRAEELSGGKLKLEYFPAEQLGKAKDMLELTKSGVTDVGYIAPAYLGKMPLSSVMELPGGLRSSTEGAEAFWRLMTTQLAEREYLPNGVRPLFVITLRPYQLVNTKREVKSFDDAKGLKIRSAGGAMDLTISTMGAIPVSHPPAEMYEAIQRGTIDGTVMAWGSLKPYKMDELMKFGTVGANLGSFAGTYCINEQVWQKLPEDLREALKKAGEETTKLMGEVYDQEEEGVIKDAEAIGIKMYRLTPEDQDTWAEKLEPVWTDWAERQNKNGLPGTQIVEELRKILDELRS